MVAATADVTARFHNSANIPNMTIDRSFDDNDGDDCVDDNDDLRAITPRSKVMASDERRYLPYGLRVLGYVDAIEV